MLPATYWWHFSPHGTLVNSQLQENLYPARKNIHSLLWIVFWQKTTGILITLFPSNASSCCLSHTLFPGQEKQINLEQLETIAGRKWFMLFGFHFTCLIACLPTYSCNESNLVRGRLQSGKRHILTHSSLMQIRKDCLVVDDDVGGSFVIFYCRHQVKISLTKLKMNFSTFSLAR